MFIIKQSKQYNTNQTMLGVKCSIIKIQSNINITNYSIICVATCPFVSERGKALGCAFQRRKMRGVATNVYLWKTSEKLKETGQNEYSKFGSCIYI